MSEKTGRPVFPDDGPWAFISHDDRGVWITRVPNANPLEVEINLDADPAACVPLVKGMAPICGWTPPETRLYTIAEIRAATGRGA